MQISSFLKGLIFLLFLTSCQSNSYFKSVETKVLFKKKDLSIRALEIISEDTIALGYNKGFGVLYKNGPVFNTDHLYYNFPAQVNDSVFSNLSFRSLATTNSTLYALSIGNPAVLVSYRTLNDKPSLKVVYTEKNERVFYDSMAFFNDYDGIAIGDPTDGCMSILLTNDGGLNWYKMFCEDLPTARLGEAAFAASDTNIKIIGDEAWVISGGVASRVYHTQDKGQTWTVVETPLIQGKATTGGYSIDFYDKMNGFIVGGDYTDPDRNTMNKAKTTDGGKTWNLVADGTGIGYKSCVQYVPNSNAKQLVAVGFNGISYSENAGSSWTDLSDESFYSIRFLNDSIAYATGKERVAKLTFKY